MTTHLTNEHSQLYPAVNEENDPPQRIINNIENPQGAAKMYWICYILYAFLTWVLQVPTRNLAI